MKKLMKIDGMMCSHCEAKVKKTLDTVDGVSAAEVSHVSGSALVSCEGVTDAALKAAVEAQGYKVLDISEA